MKIATTIKKNLPELKYIFLLFISTRLVLTTIGVISRNLLERQYGKQYIYSNQLWLDIWGVWDSYWYINIAEDGYSAKVGTEFSDTQANYAFFPLYPMLMRLVGTVIGDKFFIAGILVSNICLIIACFLLYRLVQLKSDRQTSLETIKFLLVSPTAFILSGVFTESLYLMLAILCFYLAEKRQWLLAGITGFFLALSRSVGVLIIIPILYEYLQGKEFQFKKIRYDILFLLLIPLGLTLFAIYNYHLTGNFFAFSQIQAGWNRTLSDPFTALFKGFYRGIWQPDVKIILRMKALLESTFTVVTLGFLCIFFRKMSFSYWVFSIYSIVVPLLAGVDSMPRYILPIFPLYIVLAKLVHNRSFDKITTLSFVLIQGFLMIFWSCGYALVV
jgi:Gpi18-like mannosyltransferase